MADYFLGEIKLFPYNFAPSGWAFCAGQLMPISQNTALFSLLGTTYGGDGVQNFALPDLRGRVPVSFGQGPGLSNFVLGEQTGAENVTLQQSQLPSHTHTLQASGANAAETRPGGAVLGKPGAAIYASATDGTAMAANSLTPTGGSQPFSVLQPLLVLNFCIALQGVYPSRS